MKSDEEIAFVIMTWWTGIDHHGNPLKLWEKLDRNHFRPELEHLRAMLAGAAVADHAIQVDLVGETAADVVLEISLTDGPTAHAITGAEHDPHAPIKGKPGSGKPLLTVTAPVVIRWRPPASTTDKRSLMDVRHHGRSHTRHVAERVEARAAHARRVEQLDESARAAMAKVDRSLRLTPGDAATEET